MKKTRTSLQLIEEHYHFSRGINNNITLIFNTEEKARNCMEFPVLSSVVIIIIHVNFYSGI